MGGDDQRVRVIDRSEPQAVLHDTDQLRQLNMFAKGIADIMTRAAPVFEITRIAAKTEPEIARRIKHLYKERLENMARFVQHVAANGPCETNWMKHMRLKLSGPSLALNYSNY